MTGEPDESERPDESIKELLRHAGARAVPSADVREEVRRAVHAEWQAMANARTYRRRRIGFGIAATVAVGVFALTISLRSTTPPTVPVAVLARVDGAVSVESSSGPAQAGVHIGRQVMTGETLNTNADARIALDFGSGLSVRMDTHSRLSLLTKNRLVLHEGAIYVDASGERSAHAPLEIETAAVSVRHVGTQYQIRTHADRIAISVREGRVEVTHGDARSMAAAGERLLVARDGSVARDEISPQDASWAWASMAGPPFQIENQPLATFLQWVARETGCKLVYASAEVETAAANVTLRGSIAGLSPNAALAAVLSTTRFERSPADDEFIVIALRGRN